MAPRCRWHTGAARHAQCMRPKSSKARWAPQCRRHVGAQMALNAQQKRMSAIASKGGTQDRAPQWERLRPIGHTSYRAEPSKGMPSLVLRLWLWWWQHTNYPKYDGWCSNAFAERLRLPRACWHPGRRQAPSTVLTTSPKWMQDRAGQQLCGDLQRRQPNPQNGGHSVHRQPQHSPQRAR